MVTEPELAEVGQAENVIVTSTSVQKVYTSEIIQGMDLSLRSGTLF